MINKPKTLSIDARLDGHSITFFAMASPCEVIIESDCLGTATAIGKLVANEVWRIEAKYSRYNGNSLCSKINSANGQAISIDEETYALLQFAEQCFELSGGIFDITSGILRNVWCFDGSENIPTHSAVDNILPFVGWNKVKFSNNTISLPQNMEIDFGGIGKEYAADKAMQLVNQHTTLPVLINLGGDLCANRRRVNGMPWQVGIEHPGLSENNNVIVSLTKGALATSGDSKRFLLKNNKRYSHIINAKTGWPIENTPRSMTVAAPQCIQAGLLATLALMQGSDAESFLAQQKIKYWAFR